MSKKVRRMSIGEPSLQPDGVVCVAAMGHLSKWIDDTAVYAKEHLIAIAPHKQSIEIWNIQAKRLQVVLDMPDVFVGMPEQIEKDYGGHYLFPIIKELQFSDDGNMIAAIIEGQGIGVWLKEGLLLDFIPVDVMGLAFIPESLVLACVTRKGDIECWTVAPKRCISSFQGVHLGHVKLSIQHFLLCSIHAFMAKDTNTYIAVEFSASSGKKRDAHYGGLHIWRVMCTDEQVHSYFHASIEIDKMFVSGKNTFWLDEYAFCEAYHDEIIKLDVLTGEKKRFCTVLAGSEIVEAVADDGRYIAMANHQGEIIIWDTRRARAVSTFQAYEIRYFSMIGMHWLPQDKRLVTVGLAHGRRDKEAKIKVWKLPI